MTNEITQRLKDSLDYEFQLSFNERKQLLDYITNLQESHCEYKEKCNEYNVGCIKEILCNYQKKNNNLQQRIDKAVEYINHEWFKREQIGIAPLQFSYEELQNVLDILRGDE